MFVINDEVINFWLTPWSKPFRAACRWFTLETQPLQGRQHPDNEAPRWLRPLFLQRWVGQAIAARLQVNPHPAYHYGYESEPCWDAVAWVRYQRRVLREFSEEMLLNIFGMEAERLLRIAQEHPSLAGQIEWTCAALGASEHLAQIYHELRRRHHAARARAMLREALRAFVAGQGAPYEL